ncbi:hypothetical protein LTS18_008688, partial [Coniosporium uncinatum]
MASRAAERALRNARLSELRAQRQSGKRRLADYEVEEQDSIYDQVDEDGYKEVVRGRLNQDDFVVDDNGAGYADDGREDWDQEREVYSDDASEDDAQPRGKAAKKRKEEDLAKRSKINDGINKYFSARQVVAPAKPKLVTTAEDAAFMADLLGESELNIPNRPLSRTKPIKSESRRKTRLLSPPISENKRPAYKNEHTTRRAPSADTPPAESDNDDAGIVPPTDDDIPMSDPLPSSPVTKAVERKAQPAVKFEEEYEDDLMEVEQVKGHSAVTTNSINLSGSRPAPKIKKTDYPTPASSSPTGPTAETVDPSVWNNVTSKLNVLSSPAPETTSMGKLKAQNALEADGSLRMFWIDYTKVNGSLCLFGKVKDKSTGAFVSCFVKVDNVLRKLYFLPREYRHKHGRDTSDEVGMTDVYEEVDGLMSKLRVGMHKIKPCSRKYAFELPNVPKEADYLKLLYPYDKPALPTDLKGETFSHVFGVNTALFEQFVLWKNIKGPCWLKIEGADFNAVSNSSWCKLEAQVKTPQTITTLGDSDNLEAPPLTLMSIALRTTFNAKDNKQEILVASARIYENVSLTDTTPAEKLP